MKEGSWVERLKRRKNNILEGCKEAVRLHEGITQIPEVHNPLEGFKELIDRMVKTNTNYQRQVPDLKKEKRRNRTTTRLSHQGNSNKSGADGCNLRNITK